MFHSKFHFFALLLIIFEIQTSTCDNNRVDCSMYENNKKCTITGLTVTSKNSTFIPIAPDPIAVIKFELKNSIVPVLTGNICFTFTELKFFTAVEQHIEIVEDYAFSNCTDIVDINLEKNNIHSLGTGSFSNAKKLQRLHILGGSMEHIDVDLFSNLGELIQLLFSANGLKELQVEALRNLKKLELLYLYSNDLTDLDAKSLVENLPNLKSIYINDNNFHCDRLIEILDIFKEKNIRIPDHTYEKHIKKRDYIPRKINNIICLTKGQLESEKLKRALTGSLNELKDLPLAKEVIQLKELVTSGFNDSDSEIVNLSSTLNETTNNLDQQISSLNETLQTATVEINHSVNGLSSNQEALEQRIDDLQTQLQKLNKAIDLLVNGHKAMNDTSPNRPTDGLNGNDIDRTHDASQSNNLIVVWACLIALLVIIVAIGLFVIKKFRNVHGDVPIMSYEHRMSGSVPPHWEETNA